MKRKSIKKAIVLMLSSTLALSTAACSKDKRETETSTATSATASASSVHRLHTCNIEIPVPAIQAGRDG